MPATRRHQRRSKRTMRAGAKKNTNAGAKELRVARYIDWNLTEIDTALDTMMHVFQGYNKSYFKDYGLAAVKKKTDKIFNDLDKIPDLIKKTKYYDRNYRRSANNMK